MTTAARGMLAELRRLPSADKLEIIDELWDSIPPEDIPVPDSVLDEMDCRVEEYRRQPDRGKPWSEVERQIRESLRS